MSRWTLMDDKQVKHRIVLVLQGDHAFWFREGDRQKMESFTETIEKEGPDLRSCCPWIRQPAGSPMTSIRLVLNSQLDEVDRVKVPGLTAGWLRRLQCRRMRRRLRADFPTAVVHELASDTTTDALSIVHDLLPEHWRNWLALLQRDHVSVSHVASSIELLCRYSMDHDGLRRQSVLFNMPVGEFSRHLLVAEGAPVFMRVVTPCPDEGASTGDEAVNESLVHVRKLIRRSADIPLVTLPDVPDDNLPDAARVPQALAHLCLGLGVEMRGVFPASGRGSDRAGEDRGSMQIDKLSRIDSPDALLMRLGSWTRKKIGHRWQLTKGHRFAGQLLQVSVARNALQLRIRQLQKATLLCVWMAAVTVVVASVHGVASARERAHLSEQQQQMAARVEHLSSVSTTLNRDPAFVVHSMDRIASHQAAAPVGAAGVLATIADALDDFPSLELDDISWSVFHDVSHDTVFTRIDQAPAREQLWHESEQPDQLQVELGGKVLNDRGLRAQQRTFESFTRYLEVMPGVSAVQVIESPVSVARSSEHLSGEESAYRLSLIMGGG